jgi:acyl-CoA synthetase (AMP-forming)/AMP-acid ligase II
MPGYFHLPPDDLFSPRREADNPCRMISICITHAPYGGIVEDPAAAPEIKEIIRHCQKHLAAHKVPISFSIVEKLPYTPTGNIRRW